MAYQSKFTGAEIDERLSERCIYNITSIDTVYESVAELEAAMSGKATNGMTLPVLTDGKLPLMLYAYRANSQTWEYKEDVKASTIYCVLATNRIYRYTMAKPYFLELGNQGAKLYLHEVTFTTSENDETHTLRLVSNSSTPFRYDEGNGGLYIGGVQIINSKFGWDDWEYYDCLLTYEYSNDGAIENIAYIERSGTTRSIDITTIHQDSLTDTVTEI